MQGSHFPGVWQSAAPECCGQLSLRRASWWWLTLCHALHTLHSSLLTVQAAQYIAGPYPVVSIV